MHMTRGAVAQAAMGSIGVTVTLYWFYGWAWWTITALAIAVGGIYSLFDEGSKS
jgi:hypothetical protein